MPSNPRRSFRRRRRSLDPSLYVEQKLHDYLEELGEHERAERDQAPDKPVFTFPELAAAAQDCIRSLDPRAYYGFGKALEFTDQETAAKLEPLMSKILKLRLAAVEVDREIVNLRSAMIESEIQHPR